MNQTPMTKRPLGALATLALLAAVLPMVAAEAQFGYPGIQNIPENDFTWTWGNRRAANRGGQEDFSVFGSDAGFRCDLRGRLSVGSMGTVSRFDMRELESSIRNYQRFIVAAATRMNELEAQGELQWATLACAKPQRED